MIKAIFSFILILYSTKSCKEDEMRERAVIQEVRGDEVKVAIRQHLAACNQCSLHGQCSIDNGERVLHLVAKGNWKVGDEVWVEMREGVLIEIATLLFLVPTLILIGGSALLTKVFTPEIGIIVTLGIVGGYFCFLRCFTKRILRRFTLVPFESVAEVYDDISHYTRYPEDIRL